MNQNGDNNTPKNENNPFSLPGNYFNSFSKKMMLKIELAEELKEFELLSSIDKTVPFAIPDQYLEVKSELASYPELSAIKKRNHFEVPENYFEDNAYLLANRIIGLDELKMYPILSGIEKENNFAVPVNYFNQSAQQISVSNEVSVSGTKGRIISLVFNRKTVYAIAAMLVISLGLYFFNSKTEAAGTDCNTLACLDRNEVLKENHINALDDEALMEMVNTEELKNNLNSSLNKEEKHTQEKQQSAEAYVLENVDVNDITDEI